MPPPSLNSFALEDLDDETEEFVNSLQARHDPADDEEEDEPSGERSGEASSHSDAEVEGMEEDEPDDDEGEDDESDGNQEADDDDVDQTSDSKGGRGRVRKDKPRSSKGSGRGDDRASNRRNRRRSSSPRENPRERRVEKLSQRLRSSRLGEEDELPSEGDHPRGGRPDERVGQSAAAGQSRGRSSRPVLRWGDGQPKRGDPSFADTGAPQSDVRTNEPRILQDPHPSTQVVNNPDRAAKIQYESELKDSVTAPKSSLTNDQRLSNEQELLSLVSWFLNIKPYIVRKAWSTQVEQWVFQQIQSGSAAEYFLNNLVESEVFGQLDNGCYFSSLQSFKEGIIQEAFKNKALAVVVEETLPQIKISHKAGASAPGACKNSVGLANLVKEIMGYVPPPAAYHEYAIVGRIRSMLPTATKKALETHEAQREKGSILSFKDLIYYLTKIDQEHYSKVVPKGTNNDKKKRAASTHLQNMNTKKQSGKFIPTCTYQECGKKGHTREQCWKLHPHLKPGFAKKGKGSDLKTMKTMVSKLCNTVAEMAEAAKQTKSKE